jgi:MFS family permease
MTRDSESYLDLRHFLRTVALFRGTLGFMSGMFLFLFGPIVNDALVASRTLVGGNEAMPLELDPLQWTGILFAMGIFLEFLLEVPTGLFADILGRKVAIITSLAFRFLNLGLMFLLIVLQKNNPTLGPWGVIVLIAIYWVFYSLFFTLQNGAYEAWIKAFLEEKGEVEKQAWVFAHGENWSNALFLIGAIIGILLWTYDMPHLAYLAGMALSMLCGCACWMSMPENRRADLRADAKPRQKWGEVFWNSVAELKNRELVAVFMMNAAVTSLTYLVNLTLFIFLKNHFFSSLTDTLSVSDTKMPTDQFRYWSVGATFALALMTLLGNLVFSRWLRGRLREGQDLGVRGLVWINALFNLLLATPVLVASFIFSNPLTAHGSVFLSLLIGLMVVHKLAGSTYRVAVMTLQNRLIPPGKKETATVISLGATTKNIVIVVLIILGVGKEPASLRHWVWPALVVAVTTIAMLASVRNGGVPKISAKEKSLSGV